jgi:hypothetical protein
VDEVSAAMSFMPKLLYLARRKEGLSREQFRMRWRQHGALAMSQASWKGSVVRYVQSDVIPATGGIVDESPHCDGVCTAYFSSLEGRRQRMNAEGERPSIWRDEDETFAVRTPTVSVIVKERVLRAGPSTGLHVVELLWRHPRLESAEFNSYWEHSHAPQVMGASSISNYVTRYVQNEPIPPEGNVPWGLDCDGIEETWYVSIAALQRARADAAYSLLVTKDRAPFVSRSLTLLVTDVVLYDSINPSAVDGAVYPLAR